jgi:hypothetical protein
MTNIDDFTSTKGMFLKAADVQKNPTWKFKITAEGTVERSEKFQVDRLHVPGIFGTEEKTLDCNKTNARTIKEALGSDTATWIGAELTLSTYRTKTSDGKLTDGINVDKVVKA